MSAPDTVLAAQAGSSEAWAELYRLATPKLLVYLRARRPLDSSLSEEDLVSETWLIAAQRIHEFKGSERAFVSWLFSIATNLLLNSNRKALRRKTDPTEDFTLVEGEQWEEDWLAVEELLRLLPEKERTLVVLVDLLGFSNKEAGAQVGMSAVNVRVTRSRALKKLRKETSSDLLSPS